MGLYYDAKDGSLQTKKLTMGPTIVPTFYEPNKERKIYRKGVVVVGF